MMKIYACLIWMKTLLVTGILLCIAYPAYIYRNIKAHLNGPSVLLYATIFFVCDRVSKMMVLSHTHNMPLVIIPNFFTLTYVKNPGVAFGWFPDWRFPPIVMAFIMIVIIAYYSFQLPPEEKLTRWSLALLVGGAIGNLFDRVNYGFVVDFFLFHFGRFDFPVFNIADIAIDLGVFLLFIDIFFLSGEESEEDKESALSSAI